MSNVDLLNMNPNRAFKINGAPSLAGDFTGWSVSSGDVNHDGFSDIIVGAPYASPNGRDTAGVVYVIYGKVGGMTGIDTSSIDLASFTSAQGFKIFGAAAGDQTGLAVNIGSVNGDLYDDIIIGAPYATPSGRTNAGSVYVIYGKNGGGFTDIDLASLTAAQGFKIIGAAANNMAGFFIIGTSDLVDINGDVVGDIIIGVPNASPSGRAGAGAVYVVYGKSSPTNVDLASFSAAQGFKIIGVAAMDGLGRSVGFSSINGDGYGDIFVGAIGADPSGKNNAGAVYVIYGKSSPTDVDLASFTSVQGFKIIGANALDLAGWSVSGAGDTNNDGYGDLIIGAPTADPNGRDGAGAAYVIYGKSSPTDVDLASFTSAQGFKIMGAVAGDQTGYSVSNAGDINGDNRYDICVGAAYASPNGRPQAGAAYVIYGKNGGLSDIDLASFTVAQGFTIQGAVAGDLFGYSIKYVLDTNSDFYMDLVVGAAYAGSYIGAAYVIYGKELTIGGGGDNSLAEDIECSASTDVVDYSSSTSGVVVNLSANIGTSGYAAGDIIYNCMNIIGSAYADSLIGDASANNIQGAAGNDIIEGKAGADTLNGGAGIDSLSYSSSAFGVTVNLASSAASGGDATGDVISNFENIIGSGYADTLTGDANANNIQGGAGNDIIEGLNGGDTLDGGAGTDSLSYSNSALGVAVSLTSGSGTAGDAAGDIISNFENIVGSGYGDTLTGDANANNIQGGTGDDVIEGKAGADTLNGGTGIDSLSYSSSASGVTVNLASSTLSGGDAAGDAISNFENIIGSGNADTLTGDANANNIQGGAGNDVIEGLAGSDTLDGGTGTDSLSYANAPSAVTVSLASGTGTAGDATGDLVSNFENIIGSSYGDTLTGDASANNIQGGAGNDVIEGLAGSDTLDGGAGTDSLSYANAPSAVTVGLASGTGTAGDATGDTISNFENIIGSSYGDTLTGDANANNIQGGAGDDVIEGRAGADTLDGGAGTDIVSYVGSASGVIVSLTSGTGTANDAAGDVITNFEDIVGSNYTDILTGDVNANSIQGGAGNDIIEGMAGSDVLDGGAGTDSLSYASSTSGVAVSLATNVVSGGDALGDIVSNFENIIGSGYVDTLTGDASVNNIQGGAGDDVIEGMAGADTLDGGTGTDSLSYSSSSSGVTINLASSTASGGDASGDTISNFENIIGSGYADTLTGDASANNIQGGAGDDIIEGMAGADTLTGGAGTDSLSYSSSVSGVTVSLASGVGAAGDALGDTVSNFENIIGSGYADTLTGDASANSIQGGAGNDIIEGMAGSDTLDGGAGTDSLSYSNAASGVTVSLASGTGTAGDATGDVVSNFENIIGSSYGDILTGDTNANSIQGGTGDDVIEGMAGADTLNGGSGTDSLSYSSSSSGVTVSLTSGAGTGGDAAGDTIINFENIIGSSYGDILTGDANANSIQGGTGDDVIEGMAGADTLDGGSGTDSLSYSSSASGVTINLASSITSGGDASGDTISNFENIIGSGYADSLTGDANANSIQGGAGNDIIEGKTGADALDGGAGSDTLSYSSSASGVIVSLASGTGTAGDAAGDVLSNFENIIGSGYNDTLTGDVNDNNIQGGAGDDVIEGGTGADTLDGGAGIDSLIYSSSAFGVVVSLASGIGTAGDAAGDALSNFENIIGSSYGDILTGDSSANNILGGTGDDVIEGMGGADTLDGGAGTNTISYSSSISAVIVNFANNTLEGGHATNDVITNFRNVIGSSYADILTGDVSANSIQGGAGDDLVEGMIGADVLDGGAGIDSLSYASSSSAVTVNLASNTASGGDASGDVISNFENIIGSIYSDTLTGDANANNIQGGAGDDVIEGKAGADVLDGGVGIDSVSYSSSASGVAVSLATGTGTLGDETGDIIINFENIIGSGHNDTLAGDAGANSIQGGAGDDKLRDDNGGDDIFTGGLGADTFFVSPSGGVLSITDFNSGEGDKIDLGAFNLKYAQVLSVSQNNGNDCDIALNNKKVVLQDTDKNNMQESWFTSLVVDPSKNTPQQSSGLTAQDLAKLIPSLIGALISVGGFAAKSYYYYNPDLLGRNHYYSFASSLVPKFIMKTTANVIGEADSLIKSVLDLKNQYKEMNSQLILNQLQKALLLAEHSCKEAVKEATTVRDAANTVLAGAAGKATEVAQATYNVAATALSHYNDKAVQFAQDISSYSTVGSKAVEMNEMSPIGIALSDNKIDLVSFNGSKVSFDYNDNGTKTKTAWVGSQDAFLIYDHNDNHQVDAAKELVLTKWSKTATSDFEALKEVFDSNKDNKFDANDAEFDKFYIWQDKNQDGVSQADEMVSMHEARILQIDFDTEETVYDKFFGKEQNMNVAEVHWADGAKTLAYDLALEIIMVPTVETL